MRKKGPLRLMDRTRVQREVGVVPVGAKLSIMPAQLIRMSMLGGVRWLGAGGWGREMRWRVWKRGKWRTERSGRQLL